MNDTPEHILDIQQKIYHAMSFEKRMMIAFEMSDELIGIAKQSVRENNPEASEKEIMFLLVKRLYPNDFSEEEFEKIRNSFLSQTDS